MSKRAKALTMALGLSLLAAGWLALSSEAGPEVVQPVSGHGSASRVTMASTARSASAPSSSWPVRVLRDAGEEWAVFETELAPSAWVPSPPPPPVGTSRTESMPAVPTMPVFPYNLVGMLREDDSPKALLTNSDKTLAVRAGDVVDGAWRVVAVRDDNLALLWIPAETPHSVGYRTP